MNEDGNDFEPKHPEGSRLDTISATPDTKKALFSSLADVFPQRDGQNNSIPRSGAFASETHIYNLSLYPIGSRPDGTIGQICITEKAEPESMTVYSIKENPSTQDDALILEKDIEAVTTEDDTITGQEARRRRDEMRDLFDVTEDEASRLNTDIQSLKGRRDVRMTKFLRTAQYRLRMSDRKPDSGKSEETGK